MNTTSPNEKLAIERTEFAAERTLMAWLRTSASLITFGFTMYKALEYVSERAKEPIHRHHVLTPGSFALALVGTGLLSLFIACIQYVHRIKELVGKSGLKPEYSLAIVIAVVFLALGILAMLEIALH